MTLQAAKQRSNRQQILSGHHLVHQQQYQASPKGKVVAARYAASPKGRAYRSRYKASSKGKAAQARRDGSLKRKAAQAIYFTSPKGKAYLARKNARRRIRSTNPEAYAARVYRMHVSKEPCNRCGVTAQQIDHILALALGGTDDWSNLQPLCKPCHKLKTSEDVRLIRSAA